MARTGFFLLALAAAATWCAPASAGAFKTITIDDDYSDWAGVPVVDSDGGDNFSGPDIGDTQIANDGSYLYIRNTFPNNLALGTFMGIDIDENPATGFDIFGLGVFGQEAGWQNDFPFTSATGTFNNGQGMSGEFFGSGAANMTPFANAGSRELAISLDVLLNQDNSPLFPDDTIRIMFWTDLGTGADGLPAGFAGDDGLNFDVSGIIEYTLAAPEPTSVALAALAACAVVVGRRRG
ncbi:MAG: hypothetical protein KDA44_06400 [Planctomycetales bacterium]|nr:hypothetical protein [Planctomycetales bacterium]